jgi:hypothetical protein
MSNKAKFKYNHGRRTSEPEDLLTEKESSTCPRAYPALLSDTAAPREASDCAALDEPLVVGETRPTTLLFADPILLHGGTARPTS